MIPPLFALLCWIPISLYLFRRYPLRVAILVTFVGGWAVLPTAAFAVTSARFPYWIIGTCLPSNYLVTKASVTGAMGLIGILCFDPRSFGRLRSSYWDIPMLVWCMVPLLSGLANRQAIGACLSSELYQVLAWGVPYLAGRLYFSDTESMLLAAKAFVIGGMVYVPLCLIELFTGPQMYAHLYGYQPYRWIGAQRYLGFRPVGLLEDGNQLGIWMATSTLVALWLWRRSQVKEILGIPIGWVGSIVLMVTLLCQSVGSIVIVVGVLPFLFLGRGYVTRVLTAAVLLAILVLTSLRLANVMSVRALATHDGAAIATAHFLKKIGRNSFGWRLAQDEKHVGVALERPILGSGEWDWWKGSSSRPWSLWLLAFGMYGVVGLLALQCLQLLPVARFVSHPIARSETDGSDLRRAMAAVILMSAIDNMLNGSMILPLVLVIGGLSRP
jgi:hypothetical protein